jgi:hypothetical protein
MRKCNFSLIISGSLWLLCSLSLEAACTGSGTAFTCTAGSTIANVQSAVDSASDGATITLAAGSYAWTSGTINISNSKGVTLAGAGAGSSIVTVGGNTFIGMNGTLSGNNTHTYRITGFTFQSGSGVGIWFYGPGILNNLRIDHNTFSNWATGSIAILFGEVSTSAKFFGVIDHNIFSGPNNIMSMKVLGTNDPSQWAASVRGTSNNIFLEDNAYDFDSATDLGSGCIDAWGSSAVVFRHNTVRNCLVTAHGTTHGGGTVNFEVYENVLQRQGGDSTWQDGTRLLHHQGSGEMYFWNNVIKHSASPISETAISVTHYRSADPSVAGYSTSLGRCNGTQSRDGNTSPNSTFFGYPCWMQPGRAPSGGSPIYGTLAPIYSWNNVDFSTNGRVSLAIDNPWNAINPSVADHIKANRDYYDAVSASAQSSPSSPFNGTTGMGFGTLANRPTTCTTNTNESGGGVGYFATDQGPQGTLYRCSATNTWTVQYTPYTYPHPLQGSGGGTSQTLNSLSCAPTTLNPGQTSNCTVSLTGAATASTTVAVSNTSTVTVAVPASITISSGQQSGTFTATATTTSPIVSGPATISATLRGVSRTATVSVPPPAPVVNLNLSVQ